MHSPGNPPDAGRVHAAGEPLIELQNVTGVAMCSRALTHDSKKWTRFIPEFGFASTPGEGASE